MRKSLERLFSKAAKFALNFYQVHLSGYFGGVCRFEPSCSCYARQAFERFPPGYALLLTVRRLLRCHPWGKFGFDLVPEHRESCRE